MITLVIVVLNELPDSMLQFPRIIIVLQLHDILHGTMIALYLTLGHRVVRCVTEAVDWESFRPSLARIKPSVRKSNAGAPRRDEVLMFKGLVIQDLYGLSDEQLEYQLEDRRSFQRFLGLDSYRRAPDAKTFWAFREQLLTLGLMPATSVFYLMFAQVILQFRRDITRPVITE